MGQMHHCKKGLRKKLTKSVPYMSHSSLCLYLHHILKYLSTLHTHIHKQSYKLQTENYYAINMKGIYKHTANMQQKSGALTGDKCNCQFKRITGGCKSGSELPGHCQLYYTVSICISKNIIISTYMPLHIFKNITIATIFQKTIFFFLVVNEIPRGHFSH